MTGNANMLATQVHTPDEYALLGAQLGAAGFSPSKIEGLLSKLNRVATLNAERAAKETALAVLPDLIEALSTAHRNAALEIHRRLGRLAGQGIMGSTIHRTCAQVALDVASEEPRFAGNTAANLLPGRSS